MTKRLRADLLLLIITVVWGVSFPLMKIMLDFMPSFAYLSLRFLLAALILALIFRSNLRHFSKRTLLLGIIIGVFNFAGMALQVNGLYTTTASNSGFITGLNVVIVPLISAVLLKEKPDKASVIGVFIAFTGLFLLSGGLNMNFNIGDFLTFLCSICWALQIISIDRFTALEDASLLAIMQVGFTGVASTAIWVGTGFRSFEFNSTVITILLVTAIFGTALAFGGQTIAQKNTSPTHTALIFTAEPVFAALFAMIIPNMAGKTESLGSTSIAGGIMILAGMIISEFKLGRGRNKYEYIIEANGDKSGIK